MLKIKCGVDFVEDKRIRSNIDDQGFLEKVFHLSELKDLNPQKLAGIFALKEAVFKALGVSSNWLEIEVLYEDSGKPVIVIGETLRPRGMTSTDCSVSHENGFTIGMVTFLLHEE